MTHRTQHPATRRVGLATAVLLTAVLSSCSEPVGPTTEVAPPDELPLALNHLQETPGEVLLCKVVTDDGEAGPYDFTVTQAGGREGSLPQGSSVSLADGECVTVWVAAPNPPNQDPLVTVTVEEVNLPAGMQFDSVLVEVPDIQDPETLFDPVASAPVNAFHGGTITFYNSMVPPPPPPPSICVGLTPGYWKNWKNHYTLEQFESLLEGTIASDAAEARAILHPKGKQARDPLVKLAKFVLANQLTLNLTGTDLPNPDEAGLSEACTLPDVDGELGGTLELALDMLANPGDYDEDEILAVKDFLDAVANLGDD